MEQIESPQRNLAVLRHLAGREVHRALLPALSDDGELHSASDAQRIVARNSADAAAIPAHRVFARRQSGKSSFARISRQRHENLQLPEANPQPPALGRSGLLLRSLSRIRSARSGAPVADWRPAARDSMAAIRGER